MEGKVFIGAWVDDNARKRLKVYCVMNGVNQQDIIEQLIYRWIERDNIQKEIKKAIDVRRK